jgi:hypothetical protein
LDNFWLLSSVVFFDFLLDIIILHEKEYEEF